MKKRSMKKRKPMNREAIRDYAMLVANHFVADLGNARIVDGVQAFKLVSMIELAMCRAAAVPWEDKVIEAFKKARAR